jgi:hypothetical protein
MIRLSRRRETTEYLTILVSGCCNVIASFIPDPKL